MATSLRSVARPAARICGSCKSLETSSKSTLLHFRRIDNSLPRSRRSLPQHTQFLPSIRLLSTSPSYRLATPANTHTNTSSTSPSSSSSPPGQTASNSKPTSLNSSLSDTPLDLPADSAASPVDWTRSFHGLSSQPFSKEAADVLLAPVVEGDVEVKPDGILYLPEIKYRRILNRAFGPGGWGLAPRGESVVTPKTVTREYALVAHGR